jgi:C1A family cysteine protease
MILRNHLSIGLISLFLFTTGLYALSPNTGDSSQSGIKRTIPLNQLDSYGYPVQTEKDIDIYPDAMDDDVSFDVDQYTDTQSAEVIQLNKVTLAEKQLITQKAKAKKDKVGPYRKFSKYDTPTDYTQYRKVSVPKRSNIQAMPVLDQGHDGACVTYSTTAVLDVLHYNHSDYISQKCSLNLGNYLSKQDENFFIKSQSPYMKNILTFAETNELEEYYSGWDGTFTYLVSNQISEYGIVPKTRETVCGKPKTGIITPKKSKPYSLKPLTDTNWRIICNDLEGKQCKDKHISEIKKALDNHELVVFSISLTPQDSVYTYYENNKYGDQKNVWAYTQEIDDCVTHKNGQCMGNDDIGGHAIMAYGYREDINDPDNGMFYIRNSWGKAAGDNGDYYVTYKYLQRMLNSAISFSKN